MWKRVSAGVFDAIVISILVVGFAYLLSVIVGFSGYNNVWMASYESYEAKFGVVFQMDPADFDAMTAQQKAVYEEAYAALISDIDAMYNYNMVVNLTLVITSISILLGIGVSEFVLPLIFGNGQTLGKKVFGLGLMGTEGIKITTVQLFARTLLGKYAIETMVPVLIVMMILLGSIGVVGLAVLALIGILQLGVLISSKTNSLIHDVLAKTVVVDLASQMIFDSEQAKTQYLQRSFAEKAARRDY